MAAPSIEELVVLNKFRQAITDFDLNDKQQTDMALLAWLRAKEMLAKSLVYRKENDLDNVFAWSPPKNYAKDFPYEICGRTKDGSPVIAINFGKWDVRKAVEVGEHEIFLRHIDKGFAEVRAAMETSSPTESLGPDGKTVAIPVTQACLICDFEGYGIRQLTSVSSVQTILEFIRRYEANYPEIMKVLYVINVPRIFSIFFSIIKPLLSPRTIAKLEIFTTKDKWKPALLKNISPDQLPTYLGGTNAETCKFFTSGFAGESVDNNDDGYLSMTISAGQEFVLDFEITKSGTVLLWTFQTDSHNIGFSIIFNSKDVLPYTKVDSHSSKQEGSLVCKNTGTYTLIFDNKYSRFRSKTVHYTVHTTDP